MNYAKNLIYLLLLSYFVTNFIDRDISNIFLVILLAISIFNVLRTQVTLCIYEKYIFTTVLLLILYLIIYTSIFQTSFSDIDNYSRFLILIPMYLLFKDFRLSYETFSDGVRICSLAIAGTFIFNYVVYGNIAHFLNLASVKITTAGLLMTVLLLLIFDTVRNKTSALTKLINIILILFLSILISKIQTRGVYIGLILALVPLILYLKNNLWSFKSKVTVGIFLVSLFGVLYINSAFDRFSVITPVKFTENNQPLSIMSIINNMEESSARSRLYYYYFSIKTLYENPMIGLGSRKFEDALEDAVRNDDELSSFIHINDHAHNQFIDISVNYGLTGLVLFIVIILLSYSALIMKGQKNEYSYIGCIILLTNVGYMMTQSIFSHSQGSTFFIILLYLALANSTERSKLHKSIK